MAPHPRESFILPSRGANLAPGKAAGGGGSLRPTPGKALFLRRGGANLLTGKAAGGGESLRPIPGKALFLRRGAQTLRLEKPLPARRVCASLPGKPYSTVEGRKPFAGKSLRRAWKFAPHPRESLIPPSRGANLAPGSRRPQMQTPASVSSLTDAGVCPLKFYTSLKSYSAGLSGWISGIISTSRFW